MSIAVEDRQAPSPASSTAKSVAADHPAARRFDRHWIGTLLSLEEARDVLAAVPFLGAGRGDKRASGIRLLLNWLGEHAGSTWQERWEATGADAAGRHWRQVPAGWLTDHGHGPWRRQTLIEAVPSRSAPT